MTKPNTDALVEKVARAIEDGFDMDSDGWLSEAKAVIKTARPIIEREAREKMLRELLERLPPDSCLHDASGFLEGCALSHGIDLTSEEKT